MPDAAARDAQLRLIVDHTADVVFQYNLDHKITYVSPAARRYGYDPEALIGRRASELIHPDDRAKVRALVADLFADAPMRPDQDRACRVLTADGDAVWMEGQPAIVRDDQGRPESVVTLLRDISSYRAALDALAESERRYRLIAAHTRDMIVVNNAEGEITFVSPAVKVLLGYEPHELIGRRSIELVAKIDRRPVAAVVEALIKAGPANPSARCEYRAIHRDGHEVWLEANPLAVFDAQGRLTEIQDSCRDITQRRAADAALAESERRYRLITDQSQDMILVCDAAGRLTFASPATEAVLGYRPDELLGRDGSIYVHPDDLYGLVDAVSAFTQSGPGATSPRLEYRARRKDGREIWLEANPRAIFDAAGVLVELQDNTHDITERKAMEAVLRQARDEAQAATVVKAQFLANVSHEIRTPLTAMLGYSALISARDDLDPVAREQADRIAVAGRALLALVNDVLDFSKLEAGQIDLNPGPVDPVVVARECLDLFGLHAEAKSLALRFDSAPGVPPWVSLDSQALRQVLLNLVGNAVKFTEAGQVALSLAYDPEVGQLRIEVRDTGPGLTPDQAERLFQRFSQVDGRADRRHGGTGLGLAICRGLVEAMGGTIGVDSRPGEGSVFRLVLPAPLAAEPAAIRDGDDVISVDGVRLLVVDDNPINRELVRLSLTALGVEVTEAVDGTEGLDIIASQPVDVILLDLRMPGLDGREVLAQLRSRDGPNQNVPVLAFSADIDARGCGAEGFDGFVSKPIDPEGLILAIARWTGVLDLG